MSTTNRNYKVVYDPELDSNPIKQSTNPILEYENDQGDAKDPRFIELNYEKKSRLYKTQFIVVEFDKASLAEKGDSSKKTVLLSNISPLSTESQISTVLSVYGTVNRIEIIKDPKTGGPLGYVKATFMEESSASSAVKNGNGRRVVISDSMKIEFDFTGEKLTAALSPVEKIPDIKQDINEHRPFVHRHSTSNINDDMRSRRKSSRWVSSVMGDRIQRSFSNYQDYRSHPIYNERSSSALVQRPYVKAVIPRKNLPFIHGALEELERLFYPFGYIDIYHDAYDWFIIFDAKQAAIQAQKYIHENNPKVIGYPIDLFLPFAATPTKPTPKNDIRTNSLPKQQANPPLQSKPLPQQKPQSTLSKVSLDTKQIFINELAEIFLKDVKNRVAGPYIYDFLNPYLSSSVITSTPAKKVDVVSSAVPETTSLPDTIVPATSASTLESEIQQQSGDDTSIYKLPRFKRSSSLKAPTSQPFDLAKLNLKPVVQQESSPLKKPTIKDGGTEKVDIATLIAPEKKASVEVDKKKFPRHNSSSSSSSSSEDDYLGSAPKTSTTNPLNRLVVSRNKKKLKKKQTQLESDSESGNDINDVESEDDDESEIDNEEAYRRITSKRRRNSKSNIAPKRRKSSSSSQHSITAIRKKVPVHMNMVIDETSNRNNINRSLANNMPNFSTPITVGSPSTMDIDIDGDDDSMVESMTVDNLEDDQAPKEQEYDQATIDKILQEIDEPDEEEEELLYEHEEDKVELSKEWNPFYQTKDVEDLEYLRIALVEKTNLNETSLITNALEKLGRSDKRLSQSARTRGYYPIPDSIKATYLNKNKAVFEPATVHPTSTGDVGRLNRVNNRRLVVGMVMQNKTMADSDILKFNQLKSRKKQLKFQKSPIHDWGLFSEEHIDANDMVIEYIGEVVRQQVAIEREREYERSGIGSSYLFRIDEDTVIDATKKGSIARFINHCCAPNCSAKIITVDKQKKIVIYANRDIEPGEEITYDYKFPIEADKIPCLCGSKFCKGTLN